MTLRCMERAVGVGVGLVLHPQEDLGLVLDPPVALALEPAHLQLRPPAAGMAIALAVAQEVPRMDGSTLQSPDNMLHSIAPVNPLGPQSPYLQLTGGSCLHRFPLCRSSPPHLQNTRLA